MPGGRRRAGRAPEDVPGPGDVPGDAPGSDPGDVAGSDPGDAPGSDPGDVPGPGPGDAPGTLRRLRWTVPAVLLLAWLAIGGIGGPYNGKLSEVQKSDAALFLPGSAESSRVAALQHGFERSQVFPAFLLVESPAALTPAQLTAVRDFAARIPALTFPVGDGTARLGDYLAPGPVPVAPSPDGRAALVLVNFDNAGIGTALPDGSNVVERAVRALREADHGLAAGGAQVYVAGPAGTVADLIEAFGGIDGLLLLVALAAVALILVIVYRSPLIPLLVLLSAGFALGLASLVVYLLADREVITLDGQTQGILSILVVGAATDYSLLLVARYREELSRHDDRYEAMWLAWRRTLEPVAASAGTVIVGLLCLLLSDLSTTRGLGPVGAIGIVGALLAALTFLPAALVLPGRNRPGEHGRWVFWPGTPHVGTGGTGTGGVATDGVVTGGVWARLARVVGARPRQVWTVTAGVLVLLAALLPTFSARGVTQAQTFLTTVESVTGGQALARHFPAGSGDPTLVIGPADRLDAMVRIADATPGVSVVTVVDTAAGTGAGTSTGGSGTGAGTSAGGSGTGAPLVVDGQVELRLTLADPADSAAAEATVTALRTALDAAGPDVLVGGTTAANLDLREVSTRDRNTIIPLVLAVILVLLALLLRSLVASLLLLVANVLSFAATLGASAVVFNHVLRLPGANPNVPLYGFVFLVALGIDYSIFLMTRVREESGRSGTRTGILTGLTVTGGVITSAGIVLAATFAALAVLPLLFLVQIAFIVAFGVLLDTFVVRSLLVPALSHDLGRVVWWPGALSRRDGPAVPPSAGSAEPTGPVEPTGPSEPACPGSAASPAPAQPV